MINDKLSPTDRTRHIDIYFFAIKYWKIDDRIIMVKIKKVPNPSNDFTKPLGYILHSCHYLCIMSHYDCQIFTNIYLYCFGKTRGCAIFVFYIYIFVITMVNYIRGYL